MDGNLPLFRSNKIIDIENKIKCERNVKKIQ